MKIKLLIVTIFTCLSSLGQSVPNTDTFSLTDVTAVTGGTSLAGAFSNSVDSYFDPLYKGTKNRLLNFRNYHVSTPTYYSYWTGSTNYTTSDNCCFPDGYGVADIPIYSADANISVGTQFWSDTGLSVPYTAWCANCWRIVASPATNTTYAVVCQSGNTASYVVQCNSLNYHMYIVSDAGYSSAVEACAYVGSTADTIYSADAQLTSSSTLFWDTSLTLYYNDEVDYNTYKWIYPAINSSDVYSYYTGSDSNVTNSLSQCVSYSISIDPEDIYTDYLETYYSVGYSTDSQTYDVVVNDTDWLSVTTGNTINGAGYMQIHILGNSTHEPRIGTVSIKLGSLTVKTITITQGS